MWFALRPLYLFVRWALGFPPVGTGAGSSGFDAASLIPERRRTRRERSMALATSMLALWTLAGSFLDVPCPASGLGVLLTLPGIAWAVMMVVPPTIPMDRTAIALAGYSLAPWFVVFVLGGPGGTQGVDLDFLVWFWGHLAGLIGLVALGLARDISKEMRAGDGRRRGEHLPR